MGRLIDADAFAVTLKQISEKQGYSELYMNVDDVLNAVIDDLQGKALYGYENCPTVEAIPKADYENRLKADFVAMLTDMLIDVEEIESREQWCDYANDNCISRYDVEDLIQQKINSLKEA